MVIGEMLKMTKQIILEQVKIIPKQLRLTRKMLLHIVTGELLKKT